MFWWEIKWWHRPNQNAWWFWVNHYAEVRVTDKRFPQRYYFTCPSPLHEMALKGWKFAPGNPDSFYTEDAVVAKEALDSLGLDFPNHDGVSCYRVYWNELVYNI
jgi:hypothetical protein